MGKRGKQDNQALEQALNSLVGLVCAEANQIYRQISLYDHGIDGEIEFKTDDGKVTGKKIYVQLKNGDSYLRFRKSDGCWIFDAEERHLGYWRNPQADVYLVILAPGKIGASPRWMNVTKYLQNRGDAQSRQLIFHGEIVDDRAILRCRDRHLTRSTRGPGGISGVSLVGLPPMGRPFFGREAELASLVHRLKTRLNTAVAGPAGFGKTTLALTALKKILDDGEIAALLFPDGVVFLDLYRLRGQRDPIWHALADALESSLFLKDTPPYERAREACRDRQVLLVLEGGEEADGQGDRATFLELVEPLSPKSRWLLLTRLTNQTLPAERIWLKETLAPEEAGRLFDSLTAGGISGDLREELLGLLDGHPLAISWAGNLLALGDESPHRLVADFTKDPLLSLQHPLQRDHTLSWLFDRSVRRLGEPSRRALKAAGLLAHAPIALALFQAAVGDEKGPVSEMEARQALRSLVQCGLLQLVDESWQVSHALAYQFAQGVSTKDSGLLVLLAQALHSRIEKELTIASPVAFAELPGLLEHATSLLSRDEAESLWPFLARPLLYGLGNRLRDLGRLRLVLLAIEAVAVGLEALPEGRRLDPLWQREKAGLLDRQGDLLIEQGSLAAALVAFRKAFAIRQALSKLEPSNSRRQQDLIVSHTKIGEVLREQGDLDGALSVFHEALGISVVLAKEDIFKSSYQRALGVIKMKIGDVLRKRGDLGGALSGFRDTRRIFGRLVAAEPSNTEWQRNLSISHNRIAEALLDQGDFEQALAGFQKALKIRSKLTVIDPQNSGLQRDLAASHDRIGRLLREQGDFAAALVAHFKALEIARLLLDVDPSNAGWRRDLALSYCSVAVCLFHLGNRDKSLYQAKQGMEIFEGLAVLDPTNATWRQYLKETQDLVADLEGLGLNRQEGLDPGLRRDDDGI